MFVINIKDHSEKCITTHTYFINDTKDFTDLCLTANVNPHTNEFACFLLPAIKPVPL